MVDVMLGSSPQQISTPPCLSLIGKLRDELLNGEIFYTLHEAQVLIEGWRKEYNQVRPHSSLGYRPPTPEAVEWPLGATRPGTPFMNAALT